jgi:gamma-glutamyltranspeptidase
MPQRGGRQPVYGANGMVATSQPLAAQAGLAVLQQGGNSVDAAIAMAVTLTVVEPMAALWGSRGAGQVPQGAGVITCRVGVWHLYAVSGT